MSMTDPIADMISRIRNALLAHHAKVKIPASKMKESIARILWQEGFVNGVEIEENGVKKEIVISLKYTDEGIPVIRAIRKVSKPGRRVYKRVKELKPVLRGQGIAIISTSRGIMTDKEARKQRLGGEVICEVY